MGVLTLDVEKMTLKNPGVIEPNDKGEYKIIVGGLNIYSGNGFYYKHTPKVEKILTGGVFKMRIDAGKVKSEDGHPNFAIYTSAVQATNRMNEIDESNTLAAIVNIDVVKSNQKDPIFGNTIYYIVATMVPEGPHKDKLIALFADPNRDLCFSVRSFSDKTKVNGIIVKEQRAFVTWDRVDAPGHAIAKKSFTNDVSMDIESLEEITYTEADIKVIRASLLDKLDTDLDLEDLNETNTLLDVFNICPEGDSCIYTKW